LRGVKLITSDAHEGLGAARRSVFGSIPLLCALLGAAGCQFHLQQNADAYVPHQRARTEMAADIRNIFNAPDKATAEKYLQMIVQ